MKFIDTHSHIYLKHFDDDISEVIDRAKNQSVHKIILPNIDSGSIERMHALAEKHSDVCYPLMGLHPTSVKENYKDELYRIFSWFDQNKYFGVGETGIDLYWDKTYINEQIDAFKQQLTLSIERNLPIIIHARESFDEIYDIISSREFQDAYGIFHAFTGTQEQAQKIISLKRYKLGIGGVITFKNSKLAEVVSKIPLQYLVLETDSPYLTPTPFRGKRNESSYVRLIAEKIADAQHISVDEVARITTDNALTVFGLSSSTI